MTALHARLSLRRLLRPLVEFSSGFVGPGAGLLAGSVRGSASKVVFIFVLYVLHQGFS
jgi:hypothetical protein